MRVAYVGYSVDPIAGWEQFAPEPRAPSNWKDKAKIDEYVREAREKQAVEASTKPLTGKLREVAVLDSRGDVPLQLNWPDTPILDFLSQFDRIACIDYSVFRSLAVANYIEKKGALDEHVQWVVTSARSGLPYLLASTKWALAPVMFDPLHAITCSTSEENTDVGLILRRYGFSLPYGPDAVTKAVVCKAICRLIGC